MGSVVDGAEPSQGGETITGGEGDAVQPSQRFAPDTRKFTTHLLPHSRSVSEASGARVGVPPSGVPQWGEVAPGTAPHVATTPTTADLVALWGGPDRLLRVRQVAEHLGVCNATVYGLC